MIRTKKQPLISFVAVATSLLACTTARADAVCDWNTKVGEIIVKREDGAASGQSHHGHRQHSRL